MDLVEGRIWVSWFGSVGLILLLYAVKAAALLMRNGIAAGVLFATAAALCVPATWALSTDWDNEHVLRIAIFVGNPVATLTVPCVSFLIDRIRSSVGHPVAWHWRAPLELVLGVPLWFLLWVLFEFLVLGWVWI